MCESLHIRDEYVNSLHEVLHDAKILLDPIRTKIIAPMVSKVSKFIKE